MKTTSDIDEKPPQRRHHQPNHPETHKQHMTPNRLRIMAAAAYLFTTGCVNFNLHDNGAQIHHHLNETSYAAPRRSNLAVLIQFFSSQDWIFELNGQTLLSEFGIGNRTLTVAIEPLNSPDEIANSVRLRAFFETKLSAQAEIDAIVQKVNGDDGPAVWECEGNVIGSTHVFKIDELENRIATLFRGAIRLSEIITHAERMHAASSKTSPTLDQS